MGVHEASVYADVKDALGIPEDEPIFILRAQDTLSVPAIARYAILAQELEMDKPDDAWFRHIDEIQAQFSQWQTSHANKVKIPD